MARTLLITTGGTISCLEGPEGLTPVLTGDDLLLRSDYHCDVLDFKLIDSSVMSDEQRAELARLIWSKRSEYDSFVVTHGTDSMAYTAAYLDCAFAGLDKAVILTGSQLPISYPGTDAIDNLNLALETALAGHKPGVYIAFAGKLLPGHAATKLETEDFSAFDSVAGWNALPDNAGEPHLREVVVPKVGIIHITPALPTEIILAYANMDAVLVLVLGAGGMPEQWVKALKKLELLDVKVYIKSQCLYGSIEQKYAAHGAARSFPSINNTSIEYAVYSIMFGLV